MKKIKFISALALGFTLLTANTNSADAEWENHNSKWYFKNEDGQYVKNKWIDDYYIGSKGIMLTNTWTPDGYYVGEDGKWIPEFKKGWSKINNKWYFFNSNGFLVKNQWIGDYYLGNDGAMLTSTWTPDNYYVGDDGKWIPEFKKGWSKINNKWFFFNNSGMLVKNQWIGNYYLGNDGIMLTNTWTPDNYYVGEDGKWIPGLTRGWSKINNNWFFFNNNGILVKNQWVGDYYLGNNGAMLTNTWTPDNYYVGEDGKWIRGYRNSNNLVVDNTEGKIRANRQSGKYHKPGGKYYNEMKESKYLVVFDTEEEAIASNFVPSKV